MEHIVVVGGGLAGHRALQALSGFDGRVTLVSDEPHRPYDRPPLSKQVLLGEMAPDETLFADVEREVTWHLGDGAVSVDTVRRAVRLAGADEVGYDGLVIATGRRARSWRGLPDLAGFYGLRSLDDALAFQQAMTTCRRVAIVGAGFIGCEVAASLHKQGVQHVTVIDVAQEPMAPMGAAAGAFARRFHENHGVRFALGATVDGFDGVDGRVSTVRLVGQEPVPADVVLLAIGSEPNTEWLRGSGIELLRGNVVCDEHCFARGADGVVVAGDVAAWPHPDSTEDHGLVCIEHWSTSREMAKVAAQNLVADPADRTTFVAVPTFWSDQYDVKIKSAGLLGAADRFVVIEEDPEHHRLVVEARRGDELVGAVVFNKNKAFIGYNRQLKDSLAVQVAA